MRVLPRKMEPEYCREQISVAAKKLKNNEAVGRNEVNTELIKYECDEIYWLMLPVKQSS